MKDSRVNTSLPGHTYLWNGLCVVRENEDVSWLKCETKFQMICGVRATNYKHLEISFSPLTATNLFFEDRKSSKTFKMSDAEDNASNAPDVAEADEVEVSEDAVSKGQMSVLDALKGVLKLALMHDGLARGLREASKALDRRQAHMCVLNEACEEEAYKKLVVALCSEHKIPLIKVPDGKQLGEWAGLCVLDREGNARKVVNCSCVVVKDWGEESQERSILLNYFQTEQ
ncbi:50S ribosomal protein L30e-like protein [Amylocarpus encephaloides]|uniref:40S ribosomal protein S12 n=1 Tax=Amylocarpus encephaloides TaxID=45428 RepID=A0A9P8C8E5_9HELO|nr:50S ribosomal protein L30e-like protein [Amylocarpus encephaloides]